MRCLPPLLAGVCLHVSSWRVSVKGSSLEFRYRKIYGIAALLLVVSLFSACDTTTAGDEEVDCYPSSGLPPACVSIAFYHLHPAWHPDSQQISYLRPRWVDEDSVDTAALYILDLLTGAERHVLDIPFPSKSSQAWSPDGEWLTFSAVKQIYKVRPDGSDLTQLTFSRENFSPAWSPDGLWIAYDDATPSAPEQGIYIVRPDGADKQWLPHVRGGHPTWHPSGEKILTIGGILPSFEYRLFQHYLSDPARRDTLNPSGHLGVVHAATYSADGQFASYDIQYRHQGRYDVFKLNTASNDIQKLTGQPAVSFGAYPAWSPDGSTIAYVNNYWREGVIWLMNPDGSNRRRMGPVAPPSFPQRR